MATDDNLFERIPWVEVWMRLRSLAGWLTHDQPDVFDAVSADDLVSETVLEFLRSPNALGWVPARGKLETFLCAVLRNKFILCSNSSSGAWRLLFVFHLSVEVLLSMV